MKKFAVLVAVALVAAFAAPVLASTNPFMDVPMNHWAYDAIGQLASKGILSGYPDGLYRGKQPTTRYEMASALARALAVVDMTKASKQDVEMLKKLVIEFKDELDALGVKVDQLDKRVALIESRLGGWKIYGVLRQDIENWQDRKYMADSKEYVDDNSAKLSRARLYLERRFGEDESMLFQVRIDPGLNYGRFMAEIPFAWDSKLTVGRFAWDTESDYYLGGSSTGNFAGGFMTVGMDSFLTDRILDGVAWSKSFGMGKVMAYVSRPNLAYMTSDNKRTSPTYGSPISALNFDAWELFFMAKLQFSERFGFDIGAQAFIGDDESRSQNTVTAAIPFELDNLWTVFAGFRFNFNDSIALRGIYYNQQINIKGWDSTTAGWYDADLDSTNAYRAHLDIGQNLLKFTSLWLEYVHLDQGFYLPTNGGLVGSLFGEDNELYGTMGNVMPADTNMWRVAAQQKWNDKWMTYAIVSVFNQDNLGSSSSSTFYGDKDAKATVWGLGVTYQYNTNVAFGLGYSKFDWNGNAENAGKADQSIFRFRTQVTF